MGAMMRWTPLKFTKKISNLKFIYQIYMIPASELKKGTFQEQFGTFTRPYLFLFSISQKHPFLRLTGEWQLFEHLKQENNYI